MHIQTIFYNLQAALCDALVEESMVRYACLVRQDFASNILGITYDGQSAYVGANSEAGNV